VRGQRDWQGWPNSSRYMWHVISFILLTYLLTYLLQQVVVTNVTKLRSQFHCSAWSNWAAEMVCGRNNNPTVASQSATRD